ncbi:unnamed protein product, partial [Ectocarpus sp. 8 AP-2014]
GAVAETLSPLPVSAVVPSATAGVDANKSSPPAATMLPPLPLNVGSGSKPSRSAVLLSPRPAADSEPLSAAAVAAWCCCGGIRSTVGGTIVAAAAAVGSSSPTAGAVSTCSEVDLKSPHASS